MGSALSWKVFEAHHAESMIETTNRFLARLVALLLPLLLFFSVFELSDMFTTQTFWFLIRCKCGEPCYSRPPQSVACFALFTLVLFALPSAGLSRQVKRGGNGALGQNGNEEMKEESVDTQES